MYLPSGIPSTLSSSVDTALQIVKLNVEGACSVEKGAFSVKRGACDDFKTGTSFTGMPGTLSWREERALMILYAKGIKLKLSGNKVYYTACALLVILKNSCSKLDCEKV